MYTKRIQIVNYGPIAELDIDFPFENETPKPLVLVGENGSGKSILLSHIVNGLITAKGVAFPETPEIEPGKVYKLRSNTYIKPGSEYYFARVDLEDSFYTSEIRMRHAKQEYPDVPAGIPESAAQAMWEKVGPKDYDHYDSNLTADPDTAKKVQEIFAKNCVLYFPFNRFEEPAWLNAENLKAQAHYMDISHFAGATTRKVIASSPLHENQNWLFDVIYDRAAFEGGWRPLSVDFSDGRGSVLITEWQGYSGQSTNNYEIALQILQRITRSNVRFGIGRRHNRVVSVISSAGSQERQLVPNIFQLSSGETSLLNLFLSVLHDFDLCGTPFTNATDIRGIVIVDEIDLHLHAIHQYEVLPDLIKMFPNVQFVVTTHSPLFALGMQRVFGEDGFALYRLPHGRQISAEEFSEFGDAYRVFTETLRFSNDMRAAIERAQKPIVFVEGTTDQRYIERASTLLAREALFSRFELRDGGGKGNLAKIWKDSLLPLTELLPQQVLLLFDCDSDKPSDTKGRLVQRSIPLQDQHLIKKGIENLFSKATLEMAHRYNPAFFSTEEQHNGTDENGQPITFPEKWSINDGEKTNLCDWLCENGTLEDFQHFELIFELIQEMLDSTEA